MTKFELSISSGYVPDWTVTDAMRELFQNAIDNEAVTPENKMTWEHDGEIIRISNKTTSLSTDTLLLGSSSKRDDNRTIGKHGEGYKIAFMVLLRNNKKIRVYNYGNREVWDVRFVNSKKYNGERVVTVFNDKKFKWTYIPNNNLTIEVSGITDEEYADIVKSNIHLREPEDGTFEKTKQVRILMDKSESGRVYVGGLYVNSVTDKLKYGYDFEPEIIKLDRDRRLAKEFDIKWYASRAWNEIIKRDRKYRDAVVEMIKNNNADVAYVESLSDGVNAQDALVEDFYDEHGSNAVPVSSNYEYETLKSSTEYKPIIVDARIKNMIVSSSAYIEPDAEDDIGPESLEAVCKKLEEWFSDIRHLINSEDTARFKDILEKLKYLAND